MANPIARQLNHGGHGEHGEKAKKRTQTGCVRGKQPPAGAARTDARATRLKWSFLVVFDPLAQRFGRRIWRADEF